MRPSRLSWYATALVIVAAACSGSGSSLPDDSFALAVSTDLGVGSDRLLVGIRAPDGTSLESPETAVVLEVSPVDDPSATQRVDGEFTPIIEGATGLYRGVFQFDRAGTWQVTVVPEDGGPLDPALFAVFGPECREPDALASGVLPCPPRPGEPAPIVETPTVADSLLADLTTDPAPDESFYRVSLSDAVTNGTKTVLVFATPAYCQTAACGPLLDNVKSIAPDHPGVDFVHVEVFTGFNEPGFVPDGAHLAPSVGPEYFALSTEPWVFVIDEQGIVEARFEGVMAVEEIESVLGS